MRKTAIKKIKAIAASMIVASSASLVGCGDDKNANNTGDSTSTCGTISNPTPISVKTIKPEAGSTVTNHEIQHEFTLMDSPLGLSAINLTPSAVHSAGEIDTTPYSYQLSINGNEQTYTSTAFAWENAPAIVDLQHTNLFTDENDCVYSLPGLNFSYDVIANNSMPQLEYDENACLTYAGASDFCGSSLEGSICQLAATCRADSDVNQCKIDCVMSTTGGSCLESADVDCIWAAFQAQDCNAMSECEGWYLVY